ncbi:MAG TPA: stage II sporulation protein M, partial [Halobacteriales archaeon]|nr:stage II sporulation protein M [Halobacteriales archaeon]
DLNAPDPQAEPEAFSAWVDGVAPAFEPLFTPVVVGTLAVGFLLTILALVVLGAMVSAGQIGACSGRLRDERGLTAGVAAVRDHSVSFLGLFVLEGVIWTVATLGAILPVAAGYAVSPTVGVLAAPFAFLLWLLVVLATRAVFAFAPVAVVVDRTGVVGSLRGATGFLRRNPVEAGGYYLIAIGALVGYSVVAGVLSLVEAGAAAAPVALLVVIPAIELVKTGLYADHRGDLAPPSAPGATVGEQVAAGLRRGLREMAAFVRGRPGVTLLAVAIGLAGFAVGWAAAGPFVGAIDASIAERLAEHVPPAAALNFFGNNLSVAVATAYAGVALSIPAALSVWFNGVLLGAVARLEVAPVALAAFVVPHGLFEIPAILVSGALGLHLGYAFWRTWRGGAGRTYLADELERAFWVLVGVGILLAVAALIEGFVSPYYWRPFV